VVGGMKYRIKSFIKEGVNMLTQKKTEETYTVAKKQDVLAALQVVNKKYGKALSMLAK
jgi:hypothetical protein